MVEALAPGAWREGRVEVCTNLPAALPPACADEERLAQVLANLLHNAIRHTPPGGIVAVTAIAEPDALVLVVNDTGDGIPAGELPHIWERFYQGSNARRNDGGSGLGLPLVKELVEAMGGRVEASSVTGQGSSFRVYLQKSGS